MRERQPCAYILASGFNGTLYVGVTSDMPVRLYRHRAGGAGFTSRYRTYRLVLFEMFEDMPAAIAREKQLKNWHRDWKKNLIEQGNPHWEDLAVGLGIALIAPSRTVDAETSSA